MAGAPVGAPDARARHQFIRGKAPLMRLDHSVIGNDTVELRIKGGVEPVDCTKSSYPSTSFLKPQKRRCSERWSSSGEAGRMTDLR